MIYFNFISDSLSGQQDLSLVCFAGKNYLVFCRAYPNDLATPRVSTLEKERRGGVVPESFNKCLWSGGQPGGKEFCP